MGSLDENWLAQAFESIDREIDDWSDDMKESLQSLLSDAEGATVIASSPSTSD